MRKLPLVLLTIAWSARSSGVCTSTGARATATNAPTRLLVIGDGFQDQEKLAEFVQQKICDGIHMNPVLNDRLNVEVRSTMTTNSKLGLKCNDCIEKCWYDGRDELRKKIETLSDEFKDAVARADMVLIVTGETCRGGCANGSIVVIPSEAGDDVLLHEIGHAIAGLLDEYGLPGQMFREEDCLTWRNCGSEDTKPWSRTPSLVAGQPLEGCKLFEKGVFHAEPYCIMANNSVDFCRACQPHFQTAVDNRQFTVVPETFSCDIVNPSISRGREQMNSGVRALTELRGDIAEIVAILPATREDLAAQYLLGSTIVELHDDKGNAILGMTSMNDAFLEARSYRLEKRPGEQRREELRVPVNSTLTPIVIPDWKVHDLEDYLRREKPNLKPHVSVIADPARFNVLDSKLILHLRKQFEPNMPDARGHHDSLDLFLKMNQQLLVFSEKAALTEFAARLSVKEGMLNVPVPHD